ncbi:MAG TPA: hypothetical protein VN038_01315 [Dyadobacter sp.]|nr:hypothetical protein [Dyadobacter sp.]
MKDTERELPENGSVGDMDACITALNAAKEHGLEAEVVCWALYHAQTNPEATIAECLMAGLSEWDV